MNEKTQPESNSRGEPVHYGRRWILIGMGVAAAAAGAAVAARRFALAPPERDDSLWSRRFDAPDGSALDLARFQGHPLMINFWATWCPPCVREMPLINAFYEQDGAKSMEILGLAVDQPEAVQHFLGRTPVRYPVGIAGFAGVDLTRKLGNTQGALPFTVLFDANGDIMQRKLGELHDRDLRTWASDLA